MITKVDTEVILLDQVITYDAAVELQARIAGHVATAKKTMTTNDDISAPNPDVNRSNSMS